MADPKFTPGPLEVVIGKEFCFHQGNRVSVVKVERISDDPADADNPDSINEQTVCEVWPAANDADIADGRLFAAAPDLFAFVERIANPNQHGDPTHPDYGPLRLEARRLVKEAAR